MIGAVSVGFYNVLKLWPETWAQATVYAVGDVVKPTSYAAHSYKCTTAGTSHATTQPTWGTTNGGTTADGTVTWTCFDPKTYNTIAPQGSTVPYVTFGVETDIPLATFADLEAIEDLTFWINAFSDKSTADLSEIVDEVLAVMDDAALTVTGYSNMVCRREFIGTIIYDPETGIFQCPLRYRVMIDKS